MSNEIVKYHNDLNTVPMRNWSREEMDFFFSILSELKDKGTEEITLDKKYLKDIANSSIKHNKRFEETMENLVRNVAQIHYIEKTSNSLELMNLFSKFKVNWEDDYSDMSVTVKVSEQFNYVLNKLEFEFTVYELAEFTSLKSTYSKTMYRILKQWKSLGEKEFNIKEFRELLDIPNSYNTGMINKRIIKAIEKELPIYFTDLKVKAIKKNTQGTPVIAYRFAWEPQRSSNQKWVNGKYNKKSNTKSLSDSDNRMNKEEREEYINKKLKQKLPIKKISDSDDKEIENIEGQVDVEEL